MKVALQTFITLFLLIYVVLCFSLVFFIGYIAMYLGGVTIYLIPLTVLLIYSLSSLVKLFNFATSLNRDLDKIKRKKRKRIMFDTYKCTKDVVMTSGNITFNKGRLYTPHSIYSLGYIFLNDNLQNHHIPYNFLKIHFNVIDVDELDITIK